MKGCETEGQNCKDHEDQQNTGLGGFFSIDLHKLRIKMDFSPYFKSVKGTSAGCFSSKKTLNMNLLVSKIKFKGFFLSNPLSPL
jgi:hypothetical protein